jgi:hypothetical protein
MRAKYAATCRAEADRPLAVDNRHRQKRQCGQSEQQRHCARFEHVPAPTQCSRAKARPRARAAHAGTAAYMATAPEYGFVQRVAFEFGAVKPREQRSPQAPEHPRRRKGKYRSRNVSPFAIGTDGKVVNSARNSVPARSRLPDTSRPAKNTALIQHRDVVVEQRLRIGEKRRHVQSGPCRVTASQNPIQPRARPTPAAGQTPQYGSKGHEPDHYGEVDVHYQRGAEDVL